MLHRHIDRPLLRPPTRGGGPTGGGEAALQAAAQDRDLRHLLHDPVGIPMDWPSPLSSMPAYTGLTTTCLQILQRRPRQPRISLSTKDGPVAIPRH